jgi:hypothetical protein
LFFTVSAEDYPSIFLVKAGRSRDIVKYDSKRYEETNDAGLSALKAFLCAEIYSLRAGELDKTKNTTAVTVGIFSTTFHCIS